MANLEIDPGYSCKKVKASAPLLLCENNLTRKVVCLVQIITYKLAINTASTPGCLDIDKSPDFTDYLLSSVSIGWLPILSLPHRQKLPCPT